MKVETAVVIVEKEAADPYKKVAHGRWYVQKSVCKFRKEAIEKLARMQGFDLTTKDSTDYNKDLLTDQNFTKYAQGILLSLTIRYYIPGRKH